MLEIEYKFYSEVAEAPKLAEELSEFLHTKPKQQNFLDTYYDTQEQTLFALGYGLRVRCEGQNQLQTLKSTAKPIAGSHSRVEYNQVLSTPTPDLSALPNEVWPEGINLPKLQSQLAPLFELQFQRSVWHWQQGNTLLEVALDVGERRVLQQSFAIFELEVELLQGTPASAWPMIADLLAQWPLRLALVNKAEWGYRALWRLPKPVLSTEAHNTQTWLQAWLDLDQVLDLGSIDIPMWQAMWQNWLTKALANLKPEAKTLWQQLQAQPSHAVKQDLAYGQLQWLLLQDLA